jgi:23S rRNA (adenine2503-C2)-methyltransferase
MPINKKWPLDELLDACKEFEKSLKPGERFTFEYVMLKDVNDSDEQARRLANLLNRHSLRAKVNLIPHNPAEPLPYQPPSEERVESFREIWNRKASTLSCASPRGRDIPRGLRATRRAQHVTSFDSAATTIESCAI